MSGKPSTSALQAAMARASKAQSGIQAAEERHVPVEYLRLDDLDVSPSQARKDFQGIDELARDIAANGVLQPVLVRPLAGGRYQLVAGERRLRASRQAQQATIPAVIRDMTDLEARMHGLRENLQREDLNAYEVARAVLDLTALQLARPADEVQAELGGAAPAEETLRVLGEALKLVNKDLTYLSYRRNYLSLLRLPAHLVAAIEQGASYSAVLAVRAATPEQQRVWLPLIISGEWSRRQVQQALQEAKQTSQPANRPANKKKVPLADDWDRQMGQVSRKFTAKRLQSLDPRRRQKAQRLLNELAQLLEE
ncbi:parB-like partition protein (plasmid) [Deinococcus proteolyticus MRP]|uniref:ParB-like partition protein n=1 Tax=Deinococcus proteolyticus (strain ATCC 35074 / DSM 20540 / JCM 6276 / NBRC 101906 / NCIMB 13154 / VKM Ac-1939 / CCM 2703 / MRP) TaxID=693977 RepID=F0RQV4_DEIPM|nr:ParB/RepB/Spo0J family partition protein [Deinococcus proteolyticus]ADY27663.1 parB-like partition protein [Deinococcus proteolyticus MRP]